MMRPDYGGFFEDYLYAVLRDHDETSRNRLFREFVAGAVFVCEACDRQFGVNAANVNEDDEVLCERCVKRAGGAARRSP